MRWQDFSGGSLFGGGVGKDGSDHAKNVKSWIRMSSGEVWGEWMSYAK